jgi:hypothetical protein
MKLLKKLVAGSVFATAALSAQASIIFPNTGDSELIAILYTINNQNSFVIDLGRTLTTFDTTLNQSFNLASSPFYATFLANNAVGTPSPITFTILGADSTGPNTGFESKVLFLASAEGSTPPAPTNANLGTRAGLTNTFLQTLSGQANNSTYSGNHISLTDGTSLDTTSGTSSSFSTISAGVLGPSGITMVAAGSKAELFKIATTFPGTTNTTSTVTDFFSGTETSSNTGAYFDLNTTTGVLSFFGAPTTDPVVNPVPEASEWAMMLSGLAMVGLMVRRRRNNI